MPDPAHGYEAWRSGMEEGGLPGFDELLSTRPEASPQEIRDEVNRSLGVGPRRVTYRDDIAAMHELAADLGLDG
jgi:hypothetical protein